MQHRIRHREQDTHQHGDLTIVTERRSDGTMVVRIHPGAESIEVHQYARPHLPRKDQTSGQD